MSADGEVVGVGQPVAIKFDENITNRAAAEKAIAITADPPVEGAFYWLNNREVRWRPEHFWKPGTAVDVAVNTYGVDLGDGMFGEDNVRTHFTIGDEIIATADDNTKILTIRVNGEVVKSMPTSMGKDSTPTASGIYIVGARFKHIIMDSSTYGVPVNSPNGYRTDVDWATQMSYSGVFVHSAPWSVGAQGHTNTSHGCLNVSPSNAEWFYDHIKRGDVVEVLNTVGPPLLGHRGARRLEHPLAAVESRQRQHLIRSPAGCLDAQHGTQGRKRDVGLDGSSVHGPLHGSGGEVDGLVVADRVVGHVQDQLVGSQCPRLVRAGVDLVRSPAVDDERVAARIVWWGSLIEGGLDERLGQRRYRGQRV